MSPLLLECLFGNGTLPKGLILVISLLCLILIGSLSSKVVLGCPEMSTQPGSGNNISNISTSSNTFLTFKNPTLGLRMQYPVDWVYDVSDNELTFTPMAAEEPMFQHSITITVGNNYSDYTIGPHEDLNKNLLENGSIFTVTPIIIAGHSAIKNEFTAFRIQQIPCPPPFPEPVNITNIYIPVGDKVYTIEYKDGTDSLVIAETIQQMIQSLEILP